MHNIKFKVRIKTKYLKKFLYSCLGILIFISAFIPVAILFGTFMWILFNVTDFKDGNPWLLLWLFPMIALLFTFGAKVSKWMGKTLDKAGDLITKIED